MRSGHLTAAQSRVLQRNAWFAALPPSLQNEMVQRGIVRSYAARSLVYAAGALPSGFYLVLSGEVRLEHMTKSGKFAFYQALRAADSFGLLSELDGSPRFSDARAWAETTLLHLSHVQCQELYRNDAAAREAFVALICQNLHTTLAMLVEGHSAPPRAQIAGILVSIFSHEGSEEREAPKLTHEAIAAMAGVSRQTAGKVLHEFQELGIIDMQYGKVRARDLSRLQDIAHP
jgi:CRP-like cAMP-binding protein